MSPRRLHTHTRALVNTLSPVSYLHALTDSETTINPKRPSHVPSHTHLCPVFPHLGTDSLTHSTHTLASSHTCTLTHLRTHPHVLRSQLRREKERRHLHTHEHSEKSRKDVSRRCSPPPPPTEGISFRSCPSPSLQITV